ncbi:MAG: hypothetical protein IJ405_04000 [Lachnospiraceae bacterium]|nr:hypothetical protein [Lachnospiraceae bacterium]
MAVMDEFKEERANLKNKSLWKKISYFWMYYKWYVIGILIAVLAIGGTVYSIATQKEEVLFGITLNGAPTMYEEDFVNGFMEYADIDAEESVVTINSTLRMNSSYSSESVGASEFIMVYTIAGDMDFAAMDPWGFTHYAYSSIFTDLSTLFTEKELEKLDGMVYYMDAAVARQIEELESAGKSADDVPLPNPFKPEEMQEPIPVGIDISGCRSFTDAYYYEGGTTYLAIINNSDSKDMAVKFAKYILGW